MGENAGGRPSRYRARFARDALEACGDGADNTDLAQRFGVEPRTIRDWMNRHPPFGTAIREGRAEAQGRREQGELPPRDRREKKPAIVTKLVNRFV
jgi:uncharacterized protein YjcR